MACRLSAAADVEVAVMSLPRSWQQLMAARSIMACQVISEVHVLLHAGVEGVSNQKAASQHGGA